MKREAYRHECAACRPWGNRGKNWSEKDSAMTTGLCFLISVFFAPIFAHGGIEAKIGAKKTEIKKQRPVVMAVKPVLPPSAMPAPDSTNVVTGETPNREPIEMQKASVQYAMVERGKEAFLTSTT